MLTGVICSVRNMLFELLPLYDAKLYPILGIVFFVLYSFIVLSSHFAMDNIKIFTTFVVKQFNYYLRMYEYFAVDDNYCYFRFIYQ